MADVARPGGRVGRAVAGLAVTSRASYRVAALDASTWPEFADLVECNNGIFGGCWCMGFHPQDDPADLAVESKRDRKMHRVLTDRAHAALVFDGNRCLGWCQFGGPDELPRIKNRKEYERDPAALPDWRIACCYVGKGYRRQGVAAAALAGALDLIAGLGGGVVEGYPESAEAVPAGFLYHGVLSTFESLGFTRQRKIGKHRWVVSLVVEPSA
jgi:GNAT superfamily N-acetyltransferase